MAVVVGFSHVVAIANARTKPERRAVLTSNLWHPDPAVAALEEGTVGTIALALGLNCHVVIGLMPEPAPFGIGHPARGVATAPEPGWEEGPDLAFIPRGLLRAELEQRSAGAEVVARAHHARFPGARVLHVCPPPPVAAPRPPGADGSDPLKGAAFTVPAALRREVWAIEREVIADRARRLGGLLLDPPPEAVTPDGLLGDAFWDADPSHANAAYGRLVLDQVLAS